MNNVKKITVTVIAFGLAVLSNVQTKSVYQTIFEKKKEKIEAQELTFDFTHDYILLGKAKQAILDAFHPRNAQVAIQGKTKEDVKKEDQLEWTQRSDLFIDHISQGKTTYLHAVKNKEGQAVACALFYPTCKAHKMHLKLLAVSPECQGLGLGALLVHSIFEKFPEITKIFLRTPRDQNEKAIGFYERLGCVRYCETFESIYFELTKKENK